MVKLHQSCQEIACLNGLANYFSIQQFRILCEEYCKNDEMPPGLLAKLQQCFGDPDEPTLGEDPFAATDELDAGPDGA